MSPAASQAVRSGSAGVQQVEAGPACLRLGPGSCVLKGHADALKPLEAFLAAVPAASPDSFPEASIAAENEMSEFRAESWGPQQEERTRTMGCSEVELERQQV